MRAKETLKNQIAPEPTLDQEIGLLGDDDLFDL